MSIWIASIVEPGNDWNQERSYHMCESNRLRMTCHLLHHFARRKVVVSHHRLWNMRLSRLLCQPAQPHIPHPRAM